MSLLFLAVYIVIDPRGDFPLNDDWAYARSVMSLLGGNLRLCEWQATPDLAAILSGGLMASLFSFSFQNLRLLTMLVGWAGLLVIYRAFAERTVPATAFLLTLLACFNPLYLQLSAGFMTDIWFLVPMLVSLTAFYRYQADRRQRDLVLAMAALLAAFLTRQIAVFIPLALFLSMLSSKDRRRQGLLLALLLASVVFEAALTRTLRWSGVLPPHYGYLKGVILHQILHPDLRTLQKLVYYPLNACATIGLLLLPLSLPSILRHPKRSFGLGLAGLAAVAGKFLFTHNPTPFTGNIFHLHGLGPVILHDAVSDVETAAGPLAAFWGLVSTLSLVSAGTLALWLKEEALTWEARDAFLALFVVLLAGTLSLSYLSDRYLLPVLPVVLLILARSKHLEASRVSAAGAAVLLAASTLLLRDYFLIQRTRWEAIAFAEERLQAAHADLDGGFEYNAWHDYDYETFITAAKKRKNWWTPKDTAYVVTTLESLPGYRLERTFPTNALLDSTRKTVALFSRISPGGTGSTLSQGIK